MSLGFEMAGFQSVLAVEKDAWAAETYQFNHQDTFVHVGDITEIANPKQIFDYENISGIIGGPPCQGFSLSGSRDPKDPRNSLFMDYMRFVGDFNPSFFVMENVPGILSAKTKNGQLVKEVISSVALSHGYNVHILHLNAANYGVPQARNRIFFIGIRQDYSFIMRYLQPEKITTDKPITLWDAISDLPQIEAGQGVEVVDYADLPKNTYQAWCREHSNAIHNHISMKHTQRLIERFKCIEWGNRLPMYPKNTSSANVAMRLKSVAKRIHKIICVHAPINLLRLCQPVFKVILFTPICIAILPRVKAHDCNHFPIIIFSKGKEPRCHGRKIYRNFNKLETLFRHYWQKH